MEDLSATATLDAYEEELRLTTDYEKEDDEVKRAEAAIFAAFEEEEPEKASEPEQKEVQEVPAAAEPVLQAESGVYSGSFGISGLDYTKTHRLEVTVADGLGQVSRMLTVNKGMPVFDWGEEDFCFHVPVQLPQLQIGNVTLADYIRQVVEGGIQ